MAIPLNIYQNVSGRILLGTPALPTLQADSFKLYYSMASGGPFAYFRSFPNVPDKTLYPGNALIQFRRSDLGVSSTVPVYFKATTLKGATESALGNSTLTSLPMEGAETNEEMREDLTNASQIYGYNATSGLWQRLTTDGSGKLETTATISVGGSGLATEAKQDTQIAALNSIDAGIPAALGSTTAANSMPVVIATDQFPLSIIDTLGTSQSTDISITSVSQDILQAPAIAVPLVDRKLVVLQNTSNVDIFIGTASLQGHLVPKQGGLRSFSCDSSMSVYARVVLGAHILNVWEFA